MRSGCVTIFGVLTILSLAVEAEKCLRLVLRKSDGSQTQFGIDRWNDVDCPSESNSVEVDCDDEGDVPVRIHSDAAVPTDIHVSIDGNHDIRILQKSGPAAKPEGSLSIKKLCDYVRHSEPQVYQTTPPPPIASGNGGSDLNANPPSTSGTGSDGSPSSDNNNVLTSFSKTSVLFVSVSFIILMVISLAWLVFYYVQRFRFAHAKDRMHRRLFNAAKKTLAKIPLKSLRSGDKELDCDCPVCIEPYRTGDVIRVLPCKHIFHKSCVDPWLLEHRTCPMCKMDILKAYGITFAKSEDSVHNMEGEQISAGGPSSVGAGDGASTGIPMAMPPLESDLQDPFFPSPAPSPSLLQPVLHTTDARSFSIIPMTVHGAPSRGSDSSSDSSTENFPLHRPQSTSAEIHQEREKQLRGSAARQKALLSSQSEDPFLVGTLPGGHTSPDSRNNPRQFTALDFARATPLADLGLKMKSPPPHNPSPHPLAVKHSESLQSFLTEGKRSPLPASPSAAALQVRVAGRTGYVSSITDPAEGPPRKSSSSVESV